MNAASPETLLVINPVAVPMQFALYRNGRLSESWESPGYASERLLPELERIMERERPERIFYVSGPGSQMGIKLTYITLRTLEMLRGIPFEGISAFSLNGGRPLKAMGRLYFVKEKETIITKTFQEPIAQEFSFPPVAGALEREPENRPDYRLPAV
jgi:tRNA A37 threonylcarbamoyladenosine modification protein TsaB